MGFHHPNEPSMEPTEPRFHPEFFQGFELDIRLILDIYIYIILCIYIYYITILGGYTADGSEIQLTTKVLFKPFLQIMGENGEMFTSKPQLFFFCWDFSSSTTRGGPPVVIGVISAINGFAWHSNPTVIGVKFTNPMSNVGFWAHLV